MDVWSLCGFGLDVAFREMTVRIHQDVFESRLTALRDTGIVLWDCVVSALGVSMCLSDSGSVAQINALSHTKTLSCPKQCPLFDYCEQQWRRHTALPLSAHRV